MGVVKSVILVGVLVFVSLLGIAVVRTLLLPAPRLPEPCRPGDYDYISDANRKLSARLAEALKIPTITTDKQMYDKEQLKRFIGLIEKSFPRIHSCPYIQREVVADYSLLFTVKGRDPSLKPYLLAGHLDVVPVDENNWEVPPFSGIIKDGFIWGRGAVDAKDIVMGILEALEFLVEKGFQPKRSFFVAFGHDEEGLGVDGAAKIGELLESRRVKLEFVFDEGTMIMNETFPGVKIPVALVGVNEKGYLTVKVQANGTSGHAAIPPSETPIVTLSKALAKFHGQAHPNMFGHGIEKALLESLAPYSSFLHKMVYSNLWLFGPAVSWFLSFKPLTDNIIRTTTAVNYVRGGVKDNIVPGYAYAHVNHRIHPRSSVQETLDYDRNLVEDGTVTVDPIMFAEPHPTSPYDEDSFGFQTLRRSIEQVFQPIVVSPMVMIGGTDTRYYLNMTNSVYRFSCANLTPRDTHRFHGDNERISLWNYEKAVNLYYHVIVNSDAAELPKRPPLKQEL